LQARSRAAFASGLIAAVAIASGCGSSPTEPTTTGLAGTVFRGPISPLCVIGQPCEAPFVASFTVQRGTTRVAAFSSDPQGHFEVRLAPGAYIVIPGLDAPIISPSAQTRQVSVGASGLTMIELHFDTGIR
jgi:hypothetical protein